MIQVVSELPLKAMEPALRRAAGQRQALVVSVTRVGQHLLDAQPGDDAYVYCLCAAELYSALLAGDVRMSAFLPWRIAVYSQGGRVKLETVPPAEACRMLNRADLIPLAAPLDEMLRHVMEDAARPAPATVSAAAVQSRGGLGATEEQMSARGALPQRIDCRGTKIEELGGTGEHDTKGG